MVSGFRICLYIFIRIDISHIVLIVLPCFFTRLKRPVFCYEMIQKRGSGAGKAVVYSLIVIAAVQLDLCALGLPVKISDDSLDVLVTKSLTY